MLDFEKGYREVIMLGHPTDSPAWDKRPRLNQLACLELLKEASKKCNLFYISYNMGKIPDSSGRYPKLIYPKLFKFRYAAWISMSLRAWPEGCRSASVEKICLDNQESIHRLMPGFEWAAVQPAPRAKDEEPK